MFIRTLRNRNQLDVIIDRSSDANYVATTGLDWIEISDQEVNNGDYFFNNEVIPPYSDRYELLISPKVQEQEEIYKEHVGLVQPTADPIVEEDLPVIEEEVINVTPSVDPPKSPVNFDHMANDIESLRVLSISHGNLQLLLNRLSNSDNYVFDGTRVVFNTPIVNLDGTELTVCPLAHESFEDWVAHLTANSAIYQAKIDLINSLIPN